MGPILYVLLNIAIAMATAVFWELVAYLMHRYVMHGFGWILHRDHHVTSGRRLQKNDGYALLFAFCSFVLIFTGLKNGWWPMASAGFGVGLYGTAYFTFHEVMFHKRIPAIQLQPKSRYLRRIIDAHRTHHGNVTRGGATNFSFLWAPHRNDSERS